MTTTLGLEVDAEMIVDLVLRMAPWSFLAGVYLAESTLNVLTISNEESRTDVLFDAVVFAATNAFFAFLMFEYIAIFTG